eukprot:TRINITY_DN10212_c0_g1_i1.p1 TRINITY_DN10212_c0_g1~~TRINITY_DN10212_c0_g1_i1.p1  ORF type:complete len:164 (-),score=26.59 TRINITY_DN10212_c0_g1_i1:270-761(-)
MNGSAFVAGQELFCYSHSHQRWMPARAEAIHSDGRVTAKYHRTQETKDVPLAQQAELLHAAPPGEKIQLKMTTTWQKEFKGQSDFSGNEIHDDGLLDVGNECTLDTFCKLYGKLDIMMSVNGQESWKAMVMGGQSFDCKVCGRQTLKELGFKTGDEVNLVYCR